MSYVKQKYHSVSFPASQRFAAAQFYALNERGGTTRHFAEEGAVRYILDATNRLYIRAANQHTSAVGLEE